MSAAARQELARIDDGMVVGLGSGRAAEAFLTELGTRVNAGLKITAVPSSERTADLARAVG